RRHPVQYRKPDSPRLSDLPLAAAFAAQPAVGLVVGFELFLVRVPEQLAVEPVADVAEVADARRAVADLGGADALLGLADALQPIRLVVLGRVDALLVLRQRLLEDFLFAGRERIAADGDRA